MNAKPRRLPDLPGGPLVTGFCRCAAASVLLAILSTVGGCAPDDSDGPATGGIVARIVWITGEPEAGLAKGPDNTRYVAPAGVEFVNAIVDGPGFDGLVEREFDAEDEGGVIKRVPVGDDRMLTLQGLDEDRNVTHEGSEANITIKKGEVEDVGEIELDPVP